MSLWIDVKYMSMVGPQLRNFKRKGGNVWNFSCCFCGDSKTNQRKARGYVFEHKGALVYKCHKCGIATNVGGLVKHLDPTLHHEYTMETFKESLQSKVVAVNPNKATPPVEGVLEYHAFRPVIAHEFLQPLKRLDELPPTHPALAYVVKRKIPKQFHSLLYFAPKFKQYVNWVIPNKFKNLQDDHPRLIIPYFDRDGSFFAFQGRAFGKEDPKYITIKIDESKEKIYGLDRIDNGKKVLIVEGPIDSMFLPNCIAVSGSSFTSPSIMALKNHCTVIYDREPRSPELVKLIERTINRGFSVCLWPETATFKDINDAVLQGIDQSEILDMIKQNTYNGLEAKARFALWRKC